MNRLPELAEHGSIVDNLVRISGCDRPTVQDGMSWGRGPEIAFGFLRPGTAGSFFPGSPDGFMINGPATERFCRECCPDGLLGLGIAILHEYTHFLYQKCRGLEPAAVVDAGDSFERHTYDPEMNRRADDAFMWGCP